MKKRKMRTILEGKKKRKQETRLDYLRLKKSKDKILTIKEKADLMDLSLLLPDRKPMANTMKRTKDIATNLSYGGVIREFREGMYSGCFIWNDIKIELPSTNNLQIINHEIAQVHLDLIKCNV